METNTQYFILQNEKTNLADHLHLTMNLNILSPYIFIFNFFSKKYKQYENDL